MPNQRCRGHGCRVSSGSLMSHVRACWVIVAVFFAIPDDCLMRLIRPLMSGSLTACSLGPEGRVKGAAG